jgi:glucose-6-phosphate isomerase
MQSISSPLISISGSHLEGKNIDKIVRRIKDLEGLFADQEAFKKIDKEMIVYEVESYFPVTDGTEGGLFFGITRIRPGKIGNEYFMTKGHSHTIENRAEYYWGIEGEGVLLFMDKTRNIRAECISPGSLHYINGEISHRVVNTGGSVLSFGACWPSDAGHNYETVARTGFSARVIEVDGKPEVKKAIIL